MKVCDGGSTGMMTAPPPDGPAPAFTQTSVMTNPSSTVIVIEVTSGSSGTSILPESSSGQIWPAGGSAYAGAALDEAIRQWERE